VAFVSVLKREYQSRHGMIIFCYVRAWRRDDIDITVRALRTVGSLLLASTLVLGTADVCSEDYPTKPIRLVVGGVGSGGDYAARLIAPTLSANLGRQVVVDNRGGGTLAIEIVAKAPADGYTLLLNASNLWLSPFLRKSIPYDPVNDFAAITLVTRSPNVLVVHPSLSVRTVRELIAVAKANPGALNYGSGATASANHLAAELFKAMAGVDIVHVNYRSTGPALNALIGGEVHLGFPTASAVAPHLRSGRLRGLAVTSAEASALTPGLPTVAASGLPGYEAVSIYGMFAPAGIQTGILSRLNREIVTVLNKAEVKDRFFNAGTEVVASSPGQLVATIKSEMARMGKVIRDAGIYEE